MADNKKLQNAKSEKNGEFYTEYSTISNEISKMREQFRNQIVYCNCDDPTWSNFWRYFHNNFASLGLKKLISTHYVKNSEPSYALIYEGGDDFNMDAGKIIPLHGNDQYTAGDFRSQECLSYLDECSICTTNPPFALFNEFIKVLMDHHKKFVILGNQNASHNKEIFPLFKNNKVWYGSSIHSGGIDFRIPDDYDHYSNNVFIKDGHHYINLAGIRWFTNMDTPIRHDGLWHKNGIFDQTQAHYYYEGHESEYRHYDNFNGIDVTSANAIPIDYSGYIGCPITILDRYNPDEIELIGIGSGSMAANIGVKKNYRGRTDIAYTLPDGTHKCPFSRVIIRNLHPIAKEDDKGY